MTYGKGPERGNSFGRPWTNGCMPEPVASSKVPDGCFPLPVARLIEESSFRRTRQALKLIRETIAFAEESRRTGRSLSDPSDANVSYRVPQLSNCESVGFQIASQRKPVGVASPWNLHIRNGKTPEVWVEWSIANGKTGFGVYQIDGTLRPSRSVADIGDLAARLPLRDQLPLRIDFLRTVNLLAGKVKEGDFVFDPEKDLVLPKKQAELMARKRVCRMIRGARDEAITRAEYDPLWTRVIGDPKSRFFYLPKSEGVIALSAKSANEFVALWKLIIADEKPRLVVYARTQLPFSEITECSYEMRGRTRLYPLGRGANQFQDLLFGLDQLPTGLDFEKTTERLLTKLGAGDTSFDIEDLVKPAG